MPLYIPYIKNETSESCPDLKGQEYRASFHTHSFARGPRKKIYHGHLEGMGPRKGEHAVVKVFRDSPGTEEMCDVEISKHSLGRRLARKFNKLIPNQQYKINFTLPLKSTVERLGVGCYLTRHKSRHLDLKEWVLIEENLTLENKFQVFIRKTGERLSDEPTTLDAFLHFSYHESGGKFVLCGFQGIQTENGYLLTTPWIHWADTNLWSSSDNGLAKIRQVFGFHQCNNICYKFIRPVEDSTEEIEQSNNDKENNEANQKLDTGIDEQHMVDVMESNMCENKQRDATHLLKSNSNEKDDLTEHNK
ncbi:unnamed protein product [Candidula unifasciata]|uniref:Alpha-type protein kinase domain-containing protein n=1 Tax=Candidula unifasciata TaxID=100452 RepID=A0A8S3YH36_9EUPU|nr:unnamed protein product [Candidula unifasciata]